MNDGDLHLAHAPIVEAVVDINCDLLPNFDFASVQEAAKAALAPRYPIARRQITRRQEVGFGGAEAAPVEEIVSGLHFLTADQNQIVQFRPEGYSFNRLSPYGSLDDYLGDIEWSWNIFRELVLPVEIRGGIALRYINRILLPLENGRIDVDAYLYVNPLAAASETLVFDSFLLQSTAVEVTTSHRVNITMTTQVPENGQLPVILDIETWDGRVRVPEDWSGALEAILSLRRLKNTVFKMMVTERCLNLYR